MFAGASPSHLQRVAGVIFADPPAASYCCSGSLRPAKIWARDARSRTLLLAEMTHAMLKPELLELLVCPENHSRLTVADDALVRRLNDAVSRGELKNKAGQVVELTLGGGLVREDQAVLYPVIDDIPMLLA